MSPVPSGSGKAPDVVAAAGPHGHDTAVPRPWLVLNVVLCIGAVACAVGLRPAPAGAAAREQQDPASGRSLFVTGCSSCHGLDGMGTVRGPSLQDSGGASAYYYLVTGRMPAEDSDG